MKACKAIKQNGEQCKAKAMNDSDYCFTHNPEMKEEKRLAVIKGGLNSGRVKLDLEPLNVRTPYEAGTLLEDTLNRVRTGEMPTNIANSVGYLVTVMLKAYEASRLEQRLDDLEEALR